MISDFRLKTQLLKNFPDFLLLQAFWRPSTLNSHWWFLSAMLWASFLAYYLIQKNKDVYLYIISPFVLLFFIGYCYQTVGHIDVINNSFFLFSAFWRAFAEIGFGCMLYELYKYLEERITAPSWQMTVLEIGLLNVILIIMYRTRRDYKDFVMIFLIGALVLTTLFRCGGLSRLLDNRVSCYLGKISLGVYVNQSVFQQIIKTQFKGYPFWLMTALGLGATVLWSMLITYLWECFSKRYARK